MEELAKIFFRFVCIDFISTILNSKYVHFAIHQTKGHVYAKQVTTIYSLNTFQNPAYQSILEMWTSLNWIGQH